MVEAMEENEDMVECKECFELFPKADCIKLDIGYLCPTCADAGKLITVSDEDTFKVDFPEYEKFQDKTDIFSEEESEIENDPISTPEEAIPFLVKDEEEAIAGYEEAAKVVETSDIENKEEILDTLKHIKEEEVEHIEELTDLVTVEETEVTPDPENENDPISTEEDVEGEELVEHINEEHPAIESDQELQGIDNAVVDCKVAKVITHSEDEKPLNCEMKNKPLEKPLTEAVDYNFTEEEMTEFNMDEDGISLDSYDEYVRCNWCDEVFAKSDCEFEANLG